MVVTRRFTLRLAAGSLILVPAPSLAFGSAAEFWNTEAPENWTSEEIQELTTKSPWAKPVTAEVKAYAPLSNAGGGGGGRRGGGRSGRGGGAASPSVDSPKFPGVVRWASAKPIRLALKLQLTPELAEHYVISISGLPIVSGHGGEDGSGDSADAFAGLKTQTSLQTKGHDAVKPEVIQQDKNETSTIYFGFLPQMLPLDGDKTVTFATAMDPLNVKVKFELKQMKFKGELAL
jgi:hypothetical protein